MELQPARGLLGRRRSKRGKGGRNPGRGTTRSTSPRAAGGGLRLGAPETPTTVRVRVRVRVKGEGL